jgi:hypothetical protein
MLRVIILQKEQGYHNIAAAALHYTPFLYVGEDGAKPRLAAAGNVLIL